MLTTLLIVAFWVIVAVVILAVALFGLALMIEPPDDDNKWRAIGAVVIVTALIVGITIIVEVVKRTEDGCGNDETELTKRVGKTTISKCVPDEELAFIFKE